MIGGLGVRPAVCRVAVGWFLAMGFVDAQGSDRVEARFEGGTFDRWLFRS